MKDAIKILLAAPNRDLLQSYQKILSGKYGDAVTAFDGPQLLALLARGRYDLAVLDRTLPRVEYALLMRQLKRENIPVITCLPEPVTTGLLAEHPLANAFVAYPFQPEELYALIESVMEKRSCTEALAFANTALEAGAFRLRGGSELTCAEIDALRHILAREPLAQRDSGMLVSALNHKFARDAAGARIQYESGKGFYLVTDDE